MAILDTLETTQATFNRNDDGTVSIVTVGGTDPDLSKDEVAALRAFLSSKKAAKDDD